MSRWSVANVSIKTITLPNSHFSQLIVNPMNSPEQFDTAPEHELKIETAAILQQVVDAWQLLQTKQPLVQCITNQVAANYVANILLAAGASPAMIDNPYEAASFAAISSAISINIGTPTTEQIQAIKITAQTAQEKQVPWVLDPVGYSPVLPWRSQTVDEILLYQPSIIRGNASEIYTLAGNHSESKGVDSLLESSAVYLHAQALFPHTDCIAISGESDFILSRKDQLVFKVNGGSHLQPKVTATGCALGALTAAYAALTEPAIAALSAHIHFSIAGKLAYEQAQRVGQFNVAFLDEVFGLDADKINAYADLEIIRL